MKQLINRMMICMMVAFVSHVSSALAQDTLKSREGFMVRVIPDQTTSIKEVHYFAEDNVPAVRLYNRNDRKEKGLFFFLKKKSKRETITSTPIEETEFRTFHMDEKGRLWDINMSKGTIGWCNDPLTLSFTNRVYDTNRNRRVSTRRRTVFMNSFNGVRFIFEPNFGPMLDQGSNHVVLESFITIPRIGLETNLVANWVGFQAVIFYPGTIQFDEQSPVRNFLIDELKDDGRVDVNRGFALGLALFDGAIVAGWGKLKFDKRDFLETAPDHMRRKEFFFINFQAITSVRKVIASIKDRN